MTDPRVQIVADGYDVVGETFDEWRDGVVGDPRALWRGELVKRLPPGARVLELGCGGGVPDTRLLADRFRVTGVDVSPEQVRRASLAVPSAEFVCADFTELELDPGSFEGVAAFYSFNHVPRDLLAPLFRRVHGWLVPSGLFVAALGTGDTEGWVGEWLGTTMFFSSFPPPVNTRLLAEAGFELLRDEVVTFREPAGDATFQWILGRA
ncbi:MAG TPA: class I SAM-dependent methyltransferase [Gaiellaceae bacterium]|nr:class I SAM-dependent methyltransferase [Gaiellaceae bacterium]